MNGKPTSIRVEMYTKERIIKHCARLKITQGKLIDLCIDIAEKANFVSENSIISIQKFQREETNRIIGFIKTQDKKLIQLEENLYHFFGSNSISKNDDFFEVLKFELKKRINQEIAEEEKARNTFNRIFQMIVEIKQKYDSKEKQ